MTFNTKEEKYMFLKRELCKINKFLPSQVYIPFVNQSMRNYAILNIVASEAKIFQTKERAPLLLCIEVYRPIEMTLDDPTELYNSKEYQ
jgi:phosphatidylinositol 4-kinase